MLLYGLRLLVALLTFAVGIAAAWLLDFKPAPVSLQREIIETITVEVPDTSLKASAQSSYACPRVRPAYVVQGGTLDSKAMKKPAAVYPPAAKAAGVSGTVVVRVMVDENGEVLAAQAMSGPLMLRESAEDAAREAQFSPTLHSGQPIRVEGRVTYNFRLK